MGGAGEDASVGASANAGMDSRASAEAQGGEGGNNPRALASSSKVGSGEEVMHEGAAACGEAADGLLSSTESKSSVGETEEGRARLSGGGGTVSGSVCLGSVCPSTCSPP